MYKVSLTDYMGQKEGRIIYDGESYSDALERAKEARSIVDNKGNWIRFEVLDQHVKWAKIY
jgi:hypothetical protein